MPHSEPDTDWVLAQQTTARICTSAATVILSYPCQEQAVTLRLSPLAKEVAGHLATPAAEFIQKYSTPQEQSPSLERTELEAIPDDSGALPWPVKVAAGGADVLKLQAACAFQSFATRRLHARLLEDAEQGLDARQRGSLLHNVLARLWSVDGTDKTRLHTLDDLRRAAAEDTLSGMLTHHIREAFQKDLAAASDDVWQQAYLANEQRRVHDRILAWLECEHERQPFSVHALESQLSDITVGDLHLRVRPDRIDTLGDGTHLLIDYKTGKVSTGDWNGDRPAEPQLPVYALFGGVEQVSGVAFAQIRADETKLLARAEDLAGQVSEKLGKTTAKNRFNDEVRDSWHEALITLAGQFLSGDARVNPRDGSGTCKYCPLAGLCRVHASGLLEENDGEDSAHA
jgi:probable DNA repair protein